MYLNLRVFVFRSMSQIDGIVMVWIAFAEFFKVVET